MSETAVPKKKKGKKKLKSGKVKAAKAVSPEGSEEKPAGDNNIKTAKALRDIPEDAKQVRTKVKELSQRVDDSYMELGRLLYKVNFGRLYEEWGYESFESYVAEEIPNCGDRKAKYLVAIWKRYTVDLGVPRSKIEKIGWTKAKELLPVLDKDGKNLEKWLDNARSKSVKELQQLIARAKNKAGKGGDEFHPFSCKLTDEQFENVNETFAMLKDEAGSDKKGHLLDLLCTSYRGSKIPPGKRLNWLLKQIERTEKVKLIACKNEELARRVLKLLKAEKDSGAESEEATEERPAKAKKRPEDEETPAEEAEELEEELAGEEDEEEIVDE